MDINEAVINYIRCRDVASSSACDGQCHECKFWVPGSTYDALEKLHEYASVNPL